jgi:hypothetical protein
MKMRIIFHDGDQIEGDRKWWFPPQETNGTHHFIVTKAANPTLAGKRIAVPISSVKYFILLK